jgi:hypothetical protein
MSRISILVHVSLMCAITGTIVGVDWGFQTLHQTKVAAGNPTMVYELMGFILNSCFWFHFLPKPCMGETI